MKITVKSLTSLPAHEMEMLAVLEGHAMTWRNAQTADRTDHSTSGDLSCTFPKYFTFGPRPPCSTAHRNDEDPLSIARRRTRGLPLVG